MKAKYRCDGLCEKTGVFKSLKILTKRGSQNLYVTLIARVNEIAEIVKLVESIVDSLENV